MSTPNDRARNFLSAVTVLRDKIETPDAHPFTIPAIGAPRDRVTSLAIDASQHGPSSPFSAALK